MDRFRKILLYLRAEESDGAAFERAVELCRRSGARLELLAVTPELSVYLRYPRFSYPSLEETLRQEAEGRLEKLAARTRAAGVEVRARVRHGKPSLEITREVIAQRNDLVMLDAGGHDAMRLFQLCPAPVWAVRPGHAGAYGRILAAVDPSGQRDSERGLDRQILDLAVGLAEVENAQLDVIHAWTAGPEWGPEAVEVREKVEDLAQESLERLLQPYSLPKETAHLVEGEPAQAITTFVENNEVDLLVMGTVVRTGIAGFLMGNTAEKVLGRVGCSVLALKPAGFRSPVDAA
jgi:nucleotide-binding universal stress UspA family protein